MVWTEKQNILAFVSSYYLIDWIDGKKKKKKKIGRAKV